MQKRDTNRSDIAASKARTHNSSVELETFLERGGSLGEWYQGANVPGQLEREEKRRDAQRKALDSAVTLAFSELGAPSDDSEQRVFDRRVDEAFRMLRAGGQL